jgi:hypothetical protein
MQSCGCNSGGTKTRTVTCNESTGSWNTPTATDWGECSISDECSCDESTMPQSIKACGNCGTQIRSVTCDTVTGTWQADAWDTIACIDEGVCSAGSANCNANCQCNSGLLANGTGGCVEDRRCSAQDLDSERFCGNCSSEWCEDHGNGEYLWGPCTSYSGDYGFCSLGNDHCNEYCNCEYGYVLDGTNCKKACNKDEVLVNEWVNGGTCMPKCSCGEGYTTLKEYYNPADDDSGCCAEMKCTGLASYKYNGSCHFCPEGTQFDIIVGAYHKCFNCDDLKFQLNSPERRLENIGYCIGPGYTSIDKSYCQRCGKIEITTISVSAKTEHHISFPSVIVDRYKGYVELTSGGYIPTGIIISVEVEPEHSNVSTCLGTSKKTKSLDMSEITISSSTKVWVQDVLCSDGIKIISANSGGSFTRVSDGKIFKNCISLYNPYKEDSISFRCYYTAD